MKRKWDNDNERKRVSENKIRDRKRDIGSIPPVADMKRRRRCERSPMTWLRTYMPASFCDRFSTAAAEDIATMANTIEHGGLMAVAWPRGSGKTTTVTGLSLFALLTGRRRFLVVVGSDEAAAKQLLDGFRHELEHNDLLAADYPEACLPFQRLEGMAQRCSGQTCAGNPTGIKAKGDSIRLADTDAAWSKCGGAILVARGITGRLRGINAKDREGLVIRPDLAIIDDPQTDESARSLSQVQERIAIVNKAILGLAGPGKSISAFALVTVICKNDMADRLLDHKQCPQWQGRRRRLLSSMPTRADMWEKYVELRKDSQCAGDTLGKAARKYYKDNRKEMDAGAVATWPLRKSKHDLSAVEHCHTLLADMGPEAFRSEYQNDPIDDTLDSSEALTVDRLGERCTGEDRWTVPSDCQWLVAYSDINQDLLSWVVVAWRRDFLGHVVDYGELKGWWDKKATPEANVSAGLDALCRHLLDREWPTADGRNRKIERLGIDSGWATDTVYQFAYNSRWSGRIQPGKGEYVAPGEKMRARRSSLINADGIVLDYVAQQKVQVRLLRYDADSAKSFMAARLSGAPFVSGTLNFFGKYGTHRRFFESLCSETPHKVTAKGEEKLKWQTKPGRKDNHWLDAMVGTVALAKAYGAKLRLDACPERRKQAPKQQETEQKTPDPQSKTAVPDRKPEESRPSAPVQRQIQATYLL